MTLDQAIARYTNNAEYERRNGSIQGCMEFRQLAEWLKDYKRLLEQKSCEDAISRQAVLDGIEELKQSPWATDKRGNGFEYLITEALDTVAFLCIKQEPSVRPQEQTGHWIPTSERLPEDRREVLVTAYWHETYQVMMASYYGDGLWWCVPFNNCGEHMQRLNPKAWMPLPELYKIESEDKK